MYATPPATPTRESHRRTTSTSSSDFGAFVSVPPSQDPLAPDPSTSPSLSYFDHFTAHAKSAAEHSKRVVLDELFQHQDDPLYFIKPSHSTHDDLADALASDMHLVRADGSLKLTPRHARAPLPPCLSGSASPPSVTESPPSSPPSSPRRPVRAALSRISSGFVSLMPPTRPKSTTPSAPSLTHGSPFASTPYIPPTGAPGFAGDRAWDRGFSDILVHDEKLGLVDPTGLGLGLSGGDPTHTSYTHKSVVLAGRWDGTTRVLSEDMANLIRAQLPALTKLARHWSLLYSLDQHGISLNTLYARCEPRAPSRAHPNPPKGGLLVIQDARDAVFGAWMSEGIKLEKGGYHGSGESFLWRYHPPENNTQQGRLDVYNWTGRNAYVSLCESGFISFGGGDGHYGLYLDASLLDGSSAPCPTFGNPPLCAPHVSNAPNGVESLRTKTDVAFECVGLEVWGIGQG